MVVAKTDATPDIAQGWYGNVLCVRNRQHFVDKVHFHTNVTAK